MGTIAENETLQNLFLEIGIDSTHSSHSLKRLAETDNKYIRDLKLNVSSVLGSTNMTRKETALLALAVAVNQKNDTLIPGFETIAQKHGASAEEIAETHGCASLLGLNNVFYRFRHYMHSNEFYNKQPAGLRMSMMMNPVLGKHLFELMSLVISALNGCEKCVVSHEHSVKEQGANEPRIYDAIRLAAVIRGLCTVI